MDMGVQTLQVGEVTAKRVFKKTAWGRVHVVEWVFVFVLS